MAIEKRKPVRHRIPYEMPAISDYSIGLNKSVVHLEQLLRRKIFLSRHKDVDIEAKKEYLDSIVDAFVAKELSKYNRMYREDVSRIQEVSMRLKADCADLTNLSNRIGQEISRLDTELGSIMDIYERYNPLDHGYLGVRGVQSKIASETKDTGTDSEGALPYEQNDQRKS